MKMRVQSSCSAAISARCSRQVAPRAASAQAPPAVQVDDFDFQKYVMATAEKVNVALDAAVPMAYPETVHESIRYSLLAGVQRSGLQLDKVPLQDNDSLRRGQPTNHVKYGDDIALLAGDALLAYSFEHIARETKAKPEQIVRVIAEVGRAVGSIGLVGGQVVDIKSEGMKVPLETLEWIHVHKTAVLLEASVVTGAIVAGASDDDVERVRQYGRNIGLCFQVVDDILDVTQSSETLGKTAGKDLDSDKSTYPALLGLDESRKIAQRLNEEAKALLEPFDAEKRAPLVGLADYIYSRTN